MTSGKIIECKVTEVGTEEIKYKVSKEIDAAVYAVKKIDVKKIEFADGRIENFQDDLENPDLYGDNNKNAWKIDFISPLLGSTIFSYERSIKPGFSIEGSLGIIGLGMSPNNSKSRGAFVKFGPRFMRTPDFRKGSLRYYHVLKGAYVQPQVLFGAFNSDVSYGIIGINGPSQVNSHTTTTYGSLMVVFGKQSVFSNVFLLDFYSGIGWGFTSTSKQNIPQNSFNFESNPNRNAYGAAIGGSNFPLAATVGLKLGFLTK